MKINLLPPSARQPTRLHQRFPFYYLIAAMMVIIGAMLYSYLDNDIRERSAIVADLKIAQERLALVKSKESALEAVRQRLSELELAHSYLLSPMETSAFLIELTRLIPQDVTLRELSLTADGIVRIRGEGPSISSAARLLSQLAQSQHLSDPRLLNVTSLNPSGYSFILTCRVANGGGGA